MPAASTPAATMPQASASRADEAGGSTATTMRASGGARRDAQPPRSRRGVQSASGAVLDHLAVELLAPEPRAGVAPDDRVEEGRREVLRRCPRSRARLTATRSIGEEPAQERDRPRRRGDDLARTRPEPQAELQHVPGLLGMAPFGELVAPGGLELRPAQRIRILGREHMRDGAVCAIRACAASATRPGARRGAWIASRPDGPSTITSRAAAKVSPTSAMRAHRLWRQPAEAGGEARHPFGAGARLAGAAPAEDEPGRPVVARALGRQLMIVQRTDAPPHEFDARRAATQAVPSPASRPSQYAASRRVKSASTS